jgi:hypothetical protein
MRTLTAFVLVLVTGTADAAPAPIRRPKAPNEVVLDARTKDRAELVASFVRSTYFLYHLWRTDVFREYMGWNVKSPPTIKESQWLYRRLSVIQEDDRVRLRFDGPLPILQLVTAELVRQLEDSEHWERAYTHLQNVIQRAQGRWCGGDGDLKFIRRLWENSKLRADPVRVIRAPRPVR